jgi:hypothetical protein
MIFLIYSVCPNHRCASKIPGSDKEWHRGTLTYRHKLVIISMLSTPDFQNPQPSNEMVKIDSLDLHK